MVLADMRTDRRLRDAVADAIDHGQRCIVINLAHAEQADTSGLTAIVTAHVTAARRDAQLKLVHVSPRLREVLHVTRLDSFLQFYDTEQEAIASVATASSPSSL
jgi:anti-anti-sigma factor